MHLSKILIVCILCFSFVSCNSDEMESNDNVNLIINKNYDYLNKVRPSFKETYVREAFEIGKKLVNGDCPSTVNGNNIPQVLDYIVFTISELESAELSFNCLLSTGFVPETYYYKMVEFLDAWGEYPTVKLMYKKLYDQYIPPEKNIFGLIEFAKYYCADSAVNDLKKSRYPENPNKLMSPMEYKVFNTLVKDRCEKIKGKKIE